MNKTINLIILGSILFVTGCKNSDPIVTIYPQVEKVLSYDGGRYRIFAINPETKELISRSWLVYYVDFTVFADVPNGEPMWAKETKIIRWDTDLSYSIEIHIHSIKEIISK